MLGRKMCSNVNKLPCAEGDPRCEGHSSHAHGRNLGSTLGMVEGEGAPRWLRRTSTDAGCASGVVCGSMGRWLYPYQFYKGRYVGTAFKAYKWPFRLNLGHMIYARAQGRPRDRLHARGIGAIACSCKVRYSVCLGPQLHPQCIVGCDVGRVSELGREIGRLHPPLCTSGARVFLGRLGWNVRGQFPFWDYSTMVTLSV